LRNRSKRLNSAEGFSCTTKTLQLAVSVLQAKSETKTTHDLKITRR
jgi:hypothetical protein